MKVILLCTALLFSQWSFSQACYNISNRTNGNGQSNTCGTPNCSVAAKTGHIEVDFNPCPGTSPTLQLVAISNGSVDPAFCFDPPAACASNKIRYCFRGVNLPASGTMTLRLTTNTSTYACLYSVNGGGGTITTLPVLLSKFTTVLKNGVALLTWHTEDEYNNQKFEIERSNDNIHFTSIGSVDGHGGVGIPADYEFTDNAVLKGISYYRLKQLDVDGKSTYSVVKRIDNRVNGTQVDQLFPNPAKDKVTVHIISDKASNITLSLVDINGRTLITERKQVAAGDLYWPVNLQNLKAGLYKLVLVNEQGGLLSEKIMVQ
jgi:hypothetical protein